MHEVNHHILQELTKAGCRIDGYFACPFIDKKYAEKAAKKGLRINPEFLMDNHPDLKPNTGMIEKALFSINAKKEDCKIYIVGDRASDVEMGLNAGGIGILVESFKTKELGDRQKVMNLGKESYIAKDFFDAAKLITNCIYSKTL
jgi:histidinol phosphatase-like enzyme